MGSAVPRIAIFVSGSGSNAQAIIDRAADKQEYSVVLLVANKAKAYALERARKAGISTHVLQRDDFYNTTGLLELMKQIDAVVLAGFLWLIPPYLLRAYPDRIINIHPALLPDYGGKGMYGDRVHTAVYEDECRYSGMTIHLVNEKYDEGRILFQAHTLVEDCADADCVAERVLRLEHSYYPAVIANWLQIMQPR